MPLSAEQIELQLLIKEPGHVYSNGEMQRIFNLYKILAIGPKETQWTCKGCVSRVMSRCRAYLSYLENTGDLEKTDQ